MYDCLIDSNEIKEVTITTREKRIIGKIKNVTRSDRTRCLLFENKSMDTIFG